MSDSLSECRVVSRPWKCFTQQIHSMPMEWLCLSPGISSANTSSYYSPSIHKLFNRQTHRGAFFLNLWTFLSKHTIDFHDLEIGKSKRKCCRLSFFPIFDVSESVINCQGLKVFNYAEYDCLNFPKRHLSLTNYCCWCLLSLTQTMSLSIIFNR